MRTFKKFAPDLGSAFVILGRGVEVRRLHDVGTRSTRGVEQSFEFTVDLPRLFDDIAGCGDLPVIASAGVNPSGAGPTIATHIVDLEVDPDTGKVKILRYTAVQDAGKAVHPSYVEGQIQGGAAQGIGWALSEEYFIDGEGKMLNSSFLDYRMPTALDLPMIDTVIVEVHNPGHPYGVRGVGEVPIVPPLAAIANALYDAIGVRVDDLPLNPARVLAAIKKANGKDV